MKCWGVYDKDLEQKIDMDGRKTKKADAIKSLEIIQERRQKMGMKPANLKVISYTIEYR